ncbi:MAG: HAD family hydrolase [Acholeplasmatales bacterium]|nr:HAD family hydrolase [Acholeplasmatales bacterium]
MNKLLVLDRDGVVNIEYGDVYKEEDFRFMPGIFELCKKFQDKGYLIVIASNQAGIAKGLYTIEQYKNLNYFMLDEFERNGIHITKTYVCPHRDSDNCNCHKPKPGMIVEALKEFNASAKLSVAYGDKMSDMDAYHAAGLTKLFFVRGENAVENRDYKFTVVDSLIEEE